MICLKEQIKYNNVSRFDVLTIKMASFSRAYLILRCIVACVIFQVLNRVNHHFEMLLEEKNYV